jgi:rifampicin phosphotransferase
MTHILLFREPLAAQIAESGGKGSNLARLTQAGFPVPPGFILRAQAFREFIAAAPDLFSGLAQLPIDNPAALSTQAAVLRKDLSSLPLPASLASELREALADFPPQQAFSVRSSSTLEDLALAAFAGQYETFLNCIGEARILSAIKDCFLSFFSDRAIAYRAQRHFPHEQAAMAVVVQRMVPCDSAGVAFTINPVTGDLSELLVNSNFGLGESVVSGEGQIDQFALDKRTKSLREQRIGQKSHKVVPVTANAGAGAGATAQATSTESSSGITQIPLTPEESSAPSLSPAQLAQIAELALRVDEHYHFPQDIEWGFASNQLFLLQSRPITTIPPRWTRDESAERFPTAITPLTWDFVEDGFHRSLTFSLRLMGLPPFQGKWFAMFDHYIYGNQNAVDLYLKHIPLRPESLAQLEASIPHVRENYRWVQDLPIAWSRDLDQYLIRIGEFMAHPLESEPIPALWHYVKEVRELGSHYFQPNIAISITQSLLHRVLYHLLVLTVGPTDAPRLHDSLLAFCETKTGMINAELYSLAEEVYRTQSLRQLFHDHSSRDIIEQKLLLAFREFSARFDSFLRVHGHREVEFDAYHPTWIEIPWVVLDHIRLLVDAPAGTSSSAAQGDAAPSSKHALRLAPAQLERELRLRMHKAEIELFQRLTPSLHFFFHEFIRLARAYTSLDDLEHYQTTRLTLPLRKGLRELGHRLYVRSVIGDPIDIFFAHAASLEQAVHANDDKRWRALGESIRAEKAVYLNDCQRTPDWNLASPAAVPAGASPQTPLRSAPAANASGPLADNAAPTSILSGLPGSSGQAQGPAFLVRGIEDFAGFPKGAVIVARTTNPTWTPLFYNAVAVVTESGGPLSHGAVTAREMQIPAVMSVRNCMSTFKNGDMLRVDGSRGLVTLVKP